MFTLPNQPMRFFEAIRLSFRLWLDSFVAVLPFILLSGLIYGWPWVAQKWADPSAELFKFILIGVAFVFINLPIQNAIFTTIGHFAHGRKISVSQSVAVSLLKFPTTALWLLILMAIIGAISFGFFQAIPLMQNSTPGPTLYALLAAMLLIFFLIVVIAIYVMCTFPLILLENCSLLEALKKSVALTRNHWWFGFFFLMLMGLVSNAIERAFNHLFGLPGVMLGGFLTASLWVSAIIIYYEQLKLYKSVSEK